MKAELTALWLHTSRRRHIQFSLILVLMVVSSIAEVVSIGAVVPFLSVLMAPEQVFQYQEIKFIIVFFEFKDPNELILPITLIFILSAILSGVMRVLLLYATTRFSYATGADISIEAYRRTLFQSYSTHISLNSSELINSITNKTNTIISDVLNPSLILFSSAIIVTSIALVLFAIDPTLTTVSLFGFGFLYWIVVTYTKNKLEENSRKIAKESTQVIKSIQESIGGIREVLIEHNQDFYCRLYRKSDMPLRKALGNNQFIHGSPRFLVETVGIVLIAGLAYIMTFQHEGLESAIPVLGALALGAQRILPALQHLYGAYANIKSSHASFNDVLHILNQPLPESVLHDSRSNMVLFKKSIHLKDIGFFYDKEKGKSVLKNINIEIPKGACVGLVGSTGSGKSTLLDIIMGLLTPTSGDLMVDGSLINSSNISSWQKHIAHVPQTIYLSDDTIEKNIAFGVHEDDIDQKRVKLAARQARLDKTIESWTEKYQTVVGERGIRLSGGQRQRIGIARAIYKQAELLILDEATSALDNDTESDVMRSIQMLRKNITILIIAHRITTLKNCDQIYSLENGKLQEKKYSDLD